MDKVVFVVQIIWDRSYLWNSCQIEARAYASPGECRLGSGELLLLRASVWSETILATPVEIPRACFVLRWLQVSFLYATGCLVPIHWKLEREENVNFFIIVYVMSGVILFLCTAVTFTKAVDYVELCGFSVWFLVFWELRFRKSRCVWQEKSPVCIIFFYSCWRTEIQRLSGHLAPFPCRPSFIWRAGRLFTFHICEPNSWERFGPCNF